MTTNKELTGKLSVWIAHRNFGFITRQNGNVVERYFLHRTRIIAGVEHVHVGAFVHFNVSSVQEGENPCAIDAEIVGGAR